MPGTLNDEKFLLHLQVATVKLGALVTVLKGASQRHFQKGQLQTFHGHTGLGPLWFINGALLVLRTHPQLGFITRSHVTSAHPGLSYLATAS